MMTEPDPAPSGSQVPVLVFILVALAVAVGYEGWLLMEQGRRLDAVESLAIRNRGNILQISHGITTEGGSVRQALRELERKIVVPEPKDAGERPGHPGKP